MVDMGGNFYGYMGDMSRVFSIGKLPEKAYVAHQTCLEIQNAVVEMAKPGIVCEDLYNTCLLYTSWETFELKSRTILPFLISTSLAWSVTIVKIPHTSSIVFINFIILFVI